MADTTTTENLLLGGAFLIKESTTQDTFVPEEFDEEQKMIQETISDFIDAEITPHMAAIEKQKDNIGADLLAKFGELGFLSTHMPESLGGMDLDFNTNTIIGEEIGRCGSFSVTYNAHTGIGMLPILYFGTEAQKQKYLPELLAGTKAASYCLTEPSSGSDALSAKAKAILNDAGTHYILNGQKMWITNAGFADVFTVFAQVDGDQFTGFIVEKGMPGFTLGEEEHKLGIKGSSTRMIFLENVAVPVDNVLGQVGKGHHIAFNVLNTGRFKLGASVLGGCKEVTDSSIKFANERQQFGTSISTFGAIQHKIAEMTIQTFVSESVLYRVSHLINDKIGQLKSDGAEYADAKLKAAEEYAIECSIVKVLGSEVLDYCVDENVQIHGGMGYSEEGTAARAYRDSRINRIFEGTNEINRLVIVNTLLKRVMKGELDIVTPALAVQSELTNEVADQTVYTGLFQTEQKSLRDYKKVLLMMLGSAAKLNMEGKIDLKQEQELMMSVSDIAIAIFNLESTLLRVSKVHEQSNAKVELGVYEAILKTYFYDTNQQIYKLALDLTGSLIAEEQQDKYVAGIRKFTKYPLQDVKTLRRQIAKPLIAANEYLLK